MHHRQDPPTPYTPTLELNFEAYAPFLESADISEEDKHQLIEMLWSIVVSFVQLGYGLTPVQQVLDARPSASSACGQLPKNHDQSPLPAHNRVEYSHAITENVVTSACADDEEGVSA
ncbi:hypothetical protein [Hyphomonas jannaschiana]|uniref:Uncharacterized protein n=1 Tax=Hyphomonas jannaschiana VP2 TaxID=1280952 RepID=A0A059FGR3_9PROT|nr:hypothetical protein [Hyphomonas jannaschiana]KCZ89726.1 hypothetical protein HJA_05727 [Hyphomonas jannaschiana VP2]